MPNAHQRRVALLGKLAPLEGYNLSALPGVRFLRSNRALNLTPVLYDPGIVIVCQGRKRGYLGDEVFVYDADHYLVVSVPVPFSMETDASEAEPLLAVYLHLDFALAAELMLLVDEQQGVSAAEPMGLYSSPMDAPLGDAVLRLLEVLAVPQEAPILGPARLRELYYRIFTGEQGGSLRAALTSQGRFANISRAIRLIHGHYAEPLDVGHLADEARMSVPTFHAHFRTVTCTSPIQYLKSTRLHQARLLMLRNDIGAASASMQVGYESPSQFSREFKRLFGRTPTQEVRRLRVAYALPAPDVASGYVASH